MPADLAANRSFSSTVREKWGWFLFLGIVFAIGGIFAIAMPLISSVTVTIFLAIVLVIAGLVQIFQAFSVQGWGGFLWQLVVGLVVLMQYPFSGLWVPGTLAGISLIFTGWSYIALALAARRITA